jgi:NADP-dependent 3-hydroxy acid dehydrogenase YdfG
MNISHKIVLVTGAPSGIGAVMAKAMSGKAGYYPGRSRRIRIRIVFLGGMAVQADTTGR